MSFRHLPRYTFAMPDFIVIGAVKAGTTSLYHYLGQHPAIQMSSVNWTRFFHVDGDPPDFKTKEKTYGTELLQSSVNRYKNMCNPRIPTSIEDYLSLWNSETEGHCLGEVSPTYLHDPAVAPRIHARFPKIKLIAVLRHPVDRAYSHFVMDAREGWEKEMDFRKVIANEPYQIDDFWWGKRHYLRHGLYSSRIAEYLQLFSRDQLLVLRYDELNSQPEQFFEKLFEFLGVDKKHEVDTSIKHNAGLLRYRKQGEDKNKLYKFRAPELPSKFRSELTNFYREDIVKLQSLFGMDLSDWLSNSE
ncbi:MAG: hypothetical protein GKR91_08925 [Pseudomonadales bacterium]|nr:hypothetical protein [Pseudomonadales bacterium]